MKQPHKTTSIQLASALLVTVLVTSCATPQTPISAADSVRMRKVSTISVAAKSFSRQFVGYTVFNNESEIQDISGWKIDANIENNINSELNNKYSINSIRTQYSNEEFEHVNDLNGPWDAPAFWGPNWDKIAPSVKVHCEKNSLDGLIVVAKSKKADFLAGSNQSLSGAGIFTRGGYYQKAYIHFIAKIALYDCTSAKPIAIRDLSTQQSGHPGEILRSSPVQAMNFEQSRIPLAKQSQDNAVYVKSQLVSLSIIAVPATIKSIFSANQ